MPTLEMRITDYILSCGGMVGINVILDRFKDESPDTVRKTLKEAVKYGRLGHDDGAYIAERPVMFFRGHRLGAI